MRRKCFYCGQRGHKPEHCPKLHHDASQVPGNVVDTARERLMSSPEFQEEMNRRRARKALGSPEPRRRRWRRR